MADDPNTTGDSRIPYRSHTQFKPFEWIPCEGLELSLHHRAAFLNDARDVVHGAQLLVQLLQWDEERHDASSSDTSPAPVLNACQRSSLQRFVAVSLGLLHARVEEQCEVVRNIVGRPTPSNIQAFE